MRADFCWIWRSARRSGGRNKRRNYNTTYYVLLHTIYININQNMKSFANEILSLIWCELCTTFLIVFPFLFSFHLLFVPMIEIEFRSMIAESYYCSPLEVMWKKNEILLSEEEIIKHTHTHTDIYIQMENIIILVIIQLHMNF